MEMQGKKQTNLNAFSYMDEKSVVLCALSVEFNSTSLCGAEDK